MCSEFSQNWRSNFGINYWIEKEHELENEFKILMKEKTKLINKTKKIEKIMNNMRKVQKNIQKNMEYYIPIKNENKNKKLKVILKSDLRIFTKDDFKPRLIDYDAAFIKYKNYFKNAKEFSKLLYANCEYILNKKEAKERYEQALSEPFLNKYKIMKLINFGEEKY